MVDVVVACFDDDVANIVVVVADFDDVVKAVYRLFGVNPKAVIRMEGQVAIPDPKEEDHVILKVEVRTRIKTAFGLRLCPLLLK
jgi:hypothetical protein